SGVYSVLPNDTLGHVMDGNLRAAAPIKWDDDEVAFATKMQKTLQATPPLSSVGEVEKYTFGEQGYYSTDVGDVSWVAPTVGLNTATWVPGTPAHSWQAVAAGGIGIGYKGDPPPLNGSTLKYGFDPEGGPQWQTSDRSRKRLSRSCGRLRF